MDYLIDILTVLAYLVAGASTILKGALIIVKYTKTPKDDEAVIFLMEKLGIVGKILEAISLNVPKKGVLR